MGLKNSFNRLRSFHGSPGKKEKPRSQSAPVSRRATWLAPSFLLGMSLFVHFARLDSPREVVFDEVHFGKFMSAYCCNQERFFDIHPPHAKLFLSAAAKLGGYNGGFSFERIGQPYGSISPWSLRWFSALMGALLPMVIWLLMRQLGASRPAAFLAGFAIALDNGILVQSRMMGLDSTLLVTSFGSLALLLHSLKRTTNHRWLWMLIAGAVGGIAVGTKITGLAIFGLGAVVLFRPFFTRRSSENFVFGAKGVALLALGAIPTYLAGFVLHFALLTKPGLGDRFYKPGPSLVDNVIGLQKVMFSANYFLTKTHPASSKWWEWPLGKKPIFYWVSGDRTIYLWGNPALWWGTTLLLIVVFGAALLGRVTSLKLGTEDSRARVLQWIPLWGFFLSFLPMAAIPRALFLYHYFTPLVFATLYAVLWLDGADWIRSSRLSHQRKSYYAVLALLLLGFLVVAPVSYGLSAPFSWHSTLSAYLQGLR